MNAVGTEHALRTYYSVHSRIYDLTRWSFLFGRGRLALEIAGRLQPRRIFEIGCGTGANLARLGRILPRAELLGIDASGDMLEVAAQKLRGLGNRCELREGYYRRPLGLEPAPDLIVFSYALTMMNPGVEDAVASAAADLAPGGWVAAVDFHRARHRWFRRWMRLNHVRVEGDLLPMLEHRFARGTSRRRAVHGGLWEYFSFLGRS